MRSINVSIKACQSHNKLGKKYYFYCSHLFRQHLIAIELSEQNLPYYFALYFKVSTVSARLITNENELEIIIIQSFFSKPYTIQQLTPKNNTNNIYNEISSAFFSFINLVSWGSMLKAVPTLATVPIIVTTLTFIFHF